MILNKDTKILIIGLGVIGGGYAQALTDAGFSVRCITKEVRDIEYAKAKGMIAEGTTEVDPRIIGDSELIIFALYPTVFIQWIEDHGKLLKPGTLITDVSGVKSGVITKVQELLPRGVEFISAHPMAGRESSGVEYSDSSVFRGANYIVVPTVKNTEDAINTCEELGRILGFGRISRLSAEEHDRMIAYLSQLTHCIALTLMTANETPGLEKYTGDSFRDLTRIAKINDRMWSELFLLNKDALLREMDAFTKKFEGFKKMLENDDVEGMRAEMREATRRREFFDKPKR